MSENNGKVGRRMGILERRRLGLTFGNIARVAKDLKSKGQLAEDPTIAAGQIMAQIAAENPQTYSEPGVDWDAILEFIEALLPIILQIIEMFSAF